MKTITILGISVLFLVYFVSCKKEYNNLEIKNDQSQINKIKNWYNNQKSNHAHIYSRDGSDSSDVPIGDPEWDSTHTYSQPLTTDFVVPMRFIQESDKTNQFIILKMDSH